MRSASEAATPKTHVPLSNTVIEDEANRLFDAYLDAFAAAPEAEFLLKRSFFDKFDWKQDLQDNVLLIARADFLWFFKYFLGPDSERTIELKKRSASKDELEIEIATIQIRPHYTFEEGPVDIIYTRYFEDGNPEPLTLKNTIGAVALSEKLLSDFADDRVTHHPY